MTRRLAVLVLSLVAAVLASSLPATAGDDARGDRHVMPSAYSWLGYDVPNDTYGITVVRGRSTRSVLRVLEPRRTLGMKTPGAAFRYYYERIDNTYTGPVVTQVHRRGPGVVILHVGGFPSDELLARLSRHGTVSSFVTTVELDTYVTVAREGRVIRQFDVGFRPPREGALPEERGLDIGDRGQNTFATAWALTERLTLTHISEEWFFSEHPTFVLPGRG